MRINPRFTGLLMALIISLGMSLVLSFTMVAINVGFTDYFIFAWLRSCLIGFLVGLPTATVIVPFARRTISRLTGQGLDQ